METKSEEDDDQMSSLEDACDDNVEYPVEGESFVARRALSAQVKEDTWNNKGRIFFILDVTSTIRYVVWSLIGRAVLMWLALL